MNETYKKLKEAKNFFNKMKKAPSKPEEFISNLQSFLSSARSMTLVMQKEFCDKPNFKEWFKHEQREMRSDEMIRFFNGIEKIKIRNWSTQEKSPNRAPITYIREAYVLSPPHEGWRFSITKKKEPVWISSSGYEFNVSNFPKEHIYMFEEAPRKFLGCNLRCSSVVFLCSLYLGFLTSLFKQAREKIGYVYTL